MKNSMKISILIPAYEPDERLVHLVEALSPWDFIDSIVVVNDGSSVEKEKIFQQSRDVDKVVLLNHFVNLGKGAALKTGLNYLGCQYRNKSESGGCITVDADGQHAPQDILKIARAFQNKPEAFVLGSRSFQGQVPWKSRWGNQLTRTLFNFFTGLSLKDTQTGLRAIPFSLFGTLLKLKSNHYEFELDMILKAKESGLKILQETIETIYIDDNKGSHFNPIVDSFKIYFILFRFTLSGIFTAVFDYFCFFIIMKFSNNLLLSQYLARTVAGLFNFKLNKEHVFHSKVGVKKSLIQYFLLVYSLGFLSFLIIKAFTEHLSWSPYSSKLIAEFFLYFASFSIQKYFIFNDNKGGPA